MSKYDQDGVQKIIAADVDPKLAQEVFYKVDKVYVKNNLGKTISVEDPQIFKRILADETLKKILK